MICTVYKCSVFAHIFPLLQMCTHTVMDEQHFKIFAMNQHGDVFKGFHFFVPIRVSH